MPSPTEYAANRLKSIKDESSKRTPEGQARSSMNALRHGLTARVVVLPTEDMDAYNDSPKRSSTASTPQTPVEHQFAQTVADNQWRINRIRSIEDGMLGMGHFEAAGDFECPTAEIHSAMTAARAFRDDSKSFVNLSIYEQRLHRSMKEALRQLRELQTERRELEKTAMDDAIRLLKTKQMKGEVRLCEPRNRRRSRPPRPPRRLPLGRKSRLQPRQIHALTRSPVAPTILSSAVFPPFSEKEAA